MATPGQNSRDFPVRVSKAGGDHIDTEAARLHIDKVEVFRLALTEYFARRGQQVDFSPAKKGGAQPRVPERQTIDRVRARVEELGLPPPESEYKVWQKVYDLAWPDRQVAVEVSQRKRPADRNGWRVAHIRPAMGRAEIDKVLRALLL